MPNTHQTALEKEVRTQAAKKQVTRMDPQAVQRQAAIDRAEADPDAPKPQVGISSSQLNTSTPALRKAAMKEAAALPTNTDPKHGVSTSKANSAQKKFEKAHEA